MLGIASHTYILPFQITSSVPSISIILWIYLQSTSLWCIVFDKTCVEVPSSADINFDIWKKILFTMERSADVYREIRLLLC